MARRRTLHPEEEEIWHAVARTAKPMHPMGHVFLKAAEPKPEKKDPVAPPSGGANIRDGGDAEYEAAKKIGNTEQSIAAMISLKGRRMAGK